MSKPHSIQNIFLILLLTVLAWPALAQKKKTEPPTPVSPAKTAEDAELKKAAGAPVDPKTYLIGPEDIVMIRVWREADLSGPVSVRPDGKITLALGGDVQAGGLTPDALGKKVAEILSNYINTPQVSVSVQQVNSKRYYISGEVNRSGMFPMATPTTVLEALVNSGGFRDFAKTNKIVILRGTKRLNFNYKDVIKGKHVDQNILLENGDYIVVP
jgi:polysaccharide biosynthesis/export protein